MIVVVALFRCLDTLLSPQPCGGRPALRHSHWKRSQTMPDTDQTYPLDIITANGGVGTNRQIENQASMSGLGQVFADQHFVTGGQNFPSCKSVRWPSSMRLG